MASGTGELIDIGGDDPGIRTIRLCGNELRIDVYAEHDALNRAGGDTKNAEFMVKLAADIESRHGVKVSSAYAWEFYKAVSKLTEEVADFFSQRLGSPGPSISTPEPSVTADSEPTSTG